MSDSPALQRQVAGSHYKTLAIQPVEYSMVNQLGFCEGNVVKYVSRWRTKGGIDDLRKAAHYLQFIQESKEYRHTLHAIRMRCTAGAAWRDRITPEKFADSNNLPREEAQIVCAITNFANTGTVHYLTTAARWMDELLAMAVDGGGWTP